MPKTITSIELEPNQKENLEQINNDEPKIDWDSIKLDPHPSSYQLHHSTGEKKQSKFKVGDIVTCSKYPGEKSEVVKVDGNQICCQSPYHISGQGEWLFENEIELVSE